MKLLLRLLVSAAIFVLILRTIDPALVWETLKHANPSLLAAALLLQFGSTTVAAYRWYLVMQNLNLSQPFLFYWRSYFKGMFFNQGLPTSVGGDALRILDVSKQGFSRRDALYGVILDRIIGLVALLSINIVAHALHPDLLPVKIYFAINLLVLAGLISFVGVLLLRRPPWLASRSRIRAISDKLHQALWAQRTLLVASSLLIHLLSMLCLYATGWALGLQYNLLIYLVIVPPAILLTLIPISLAGWGIREGALVALFSFIGADKAIVLTMSILYGFILIAVSIPGLAVFLGGHKRLA